MIRWSASSSSRPSPCPPAPAMPTGSGSPSILSSGRHLSYHGRAKKEKEGRDVIKRKGIAISSSLSFRVSFSPSRHMMPISCFSRFLFIIFLSFWLFFSVSYRFVIFLTSFSRVTCLSILYVVIVLPVIFWLQCLWMVHRSNFLPWFWLSVKCLFQCLPVYMSTHSGWYLSVCMSTLVHNVFVVSMCHSRGSTKFYVYKRGSSMSVCLNLIICVYSNGRRRKRSLPQWLLSWMIHSYNFCVSGFCLLKPHVSFWLSTSVSSYLLDCLPQCICVHLSLPRSIWLSTLQSRLFFVSLP